MIFSHITQNPGEVASIATAIAYQSDALGCYQQICAGSPYSLLLESAEIDSKDNLKTLLLIDAALRLECQGLTVSVRALSPNGQSLLPFLAAKLSTLANTELQADSLQLSFTPADPLLDEASRLLHPTPLSVLRLLQSSLQSHSDEPFAIFCRRCHRLRLCRNGRAITGSADRRQCLPGLSVLSGRNLVGD